MKRRQAASSKSSRPRSGSPPRPADGSDRPRLQKVLAQAGYGSRRDCETLITEGRVEVDGQVADQLGTRVDPQQQEVRVDGEKIKVARLEYFAVNKPTGVISTNWDPTGRLRVVDLIPTASRVFTVGRLDKSSEGLMLVTNDGALAQKLTHPKFGVEKIYDVTIAGHATRDELQPLQEGVRLAEGWARAKHVRIRRATATHTYLEMVLDEGKNREIRRLLARLGHKVLRLRRIAIGPLRLADLLPGESRPLLPAEIKALQRAASGRGKKSVSKRAAPKPGSRASLERPPKRSESGPGTPSSARPLRKKKAGPRPSASAPTGKRRTSPGKRTSSLGERSATPGKRSAKPGRQSGGRPGKRAASPSSRSAGGAAKRPGQKRRRRPG